MFQPDRSHLLEDSDRDAESTSSPPPARAPPNDLVPLMAFTEVIGYTASLLILASIIQKSVLRLRIIGLLGSFTFLTYGLLIEAYPIAVLNGVGAIVHIWALRELIGRRPERFEFLPIRPDSVMLRRFLQFYANDLAKRFPNIPNPDTDPELRSVFILRDMVPSGLFMWRDGGSTNAEVLVDYVTPAYRDLKIGRFLYARTDALFDGTPITCLSATALTPDHASYLERMGFVPRGGAGRYERTVTH